MRPPVLLAVLLALAACEVGGGRWRVDSVDAWPASNPDASPAFDFAVLPPDLSAWDCPDRWDVETLGAGEPWQVDVCRPPPVPRCRAGEAAFPGDTECTPLGTRCPEPPELFLGESEIRGLVPDFDGDIVYVHREAPRSGTGTRDDPMPVKDLTLGDDVPDGTIVALAPGRYAGSIRIAGHVAVVGSCVHGTRIVTGPQVGRSHAVDLSGAGATVANLQVAGDVGGVLAHDSQATLRIHAVEIVSAREVGLETRHARVEVSWVIVRDTRGDEPAHGGVGVRVQDGDITLRHVAVARNGGVGVLVKGNPDAPPMTLLLEDVVVRGTRLGSAPFEGAGILAGGHATLTIRRSVLEQNRGAAVWLSSGGGEPSPSVVLEDVLVKDTALDSAGVGVGVKLGSGVEATLNRVIVEGSRGVGIAVLANDPATSRGTLAMTDVVVRATDLAANGMGGLGVGVLGNVDIEANRIVALDNRTAALFASGHETGTPVVTLSRVVVVDTDADEGARNGVGVAASTGAELTLDRVYVARNHGFGVAVFGWGGVPETRLHALDLRVLDTRREPCADLSIGRPKSCRHADGMGFGGGVGLVVLNGARGDVARFELKDNALAGLVVGAGAHLAARAGIVTGNRIGLNLLAEDATFDDSGGDVFVYGNDMDASHTALVLPQAPAGVL